MNVNDTEDNLTAEEGEHTTSFENTQAVLTKKKIQYMKQAIVDRSGAYDYANDPM